MPRQIGATFKMKTIMLATLLCTILILSDGDTTTMGKDNIDKEIWDKVFKIIADNSKIDPLTWLQNQTRMKPIMRKGSTYILDYDYFLEIRNLKGKKLVYLDNPSKKIDKYLLQPNNIYFIGENGIVKNIDESHLILIYKSKWIFIVNTVENLMGAISISEKGQPEGSIK